MSGYAHVRNRVIRVGLADHGDFRSTPVNGHSQDRRACLKGARNGRPVHPALTQRIPSIAPCPFWTVICKGARRRGRPIIFQGKKFNLPTFVSLVRMA